MHLSGLGQGQGAGSGAGAVVEAVPRAKAAAEAPLSSECAVEQGAVRSLRYVPCFRLGGCSSADAGPTHAVLFVVLWLRSLISGGPHHRHPVHNHACSRPKACAACGSGPAPPASRMLTCSRCRVVRYCGKGCQKAHWPHHKLVCRQLTQQRERGKGMGG